MSKQDGGSPLKGITKVRSSCIEKELLQIHWYLEAESKLASWSYFNRSPCAVLRRPKIRMMNICKWVLNTLTREPLSRKVCLTVALEPWVSTFLSTKLSCHYMLRTNCARIFFFGGGRVGCPASLRVTVKSKIKGSNRRRQGTAFWVNLAFPGRWRRSITGQQQDTQSLNESEKL